MIMRWIWASCDRAVLVDGGRSSQATGQLTDKGRTQHQLVVPVILKALLSLSASLVASHPTFLSLALVKQ